MKRGILILLVILFCFQVSSLEVGLKDYKPGETLIIELPETLQSLNPSKIQFYSGRVYVPMVSDLGKIGDSYYLYALLPNKVRNYTLTIEDAEYLNSRQDFKFNFSVKGEPVFSINPGFIITNNDFEIKIKSLESEKVISEFKSIKEVELKPGISSIIQYSIKEINTSFKYLTIKSNDTEYKIPVKIFKDIEEIDSGGVRFSKSEHRVYVPENQDFQYSLTLMNTGQEIENITLNYSKIEGVNVTLGEFHLEPGDSKEIPIIMNIGKNLTFNLKAVSDGVFSETSVKIQPKKVERINETENLFTEENSCSDLDGEICEEEEECKGVSKLTLDGLCCLGNCEKEESRGKIIAMIIIVIILMIIGFFLFKKMKAKKVPAKERLKQKSKKYEERFKSQETKNSLTKN